MRRAMRLPLSLLFLVLLAGPVAAQDRTPPTTAAEVSADRRVLTLEDYPGWKRIQAAALSPDGAWATYLYNPNEGDDTLFVKQLDGVRVHAVASAGQAQFSNDSRWIAFLVSPPEKEQEQARRANRPVVRKLRLLEPATGATWEVPDAASFRFSNNARWLAVKRNRASRDAAHQGSDLVLRELATGTVQTVGNVDEFAFSETGSHLAYTVDAADRLGNGVHLLDLERDVLATLAADTARYARLTWNEAGTAIAVLRGTTPDKQRHRTNALLLFSGIGAERPQSSTYDPAQDSEFPLGMVLSELGSVTWSDDGQRVFLGLKHQEPAAEKSDEPKANVDVWHWKDEDVQSVQMVRADANRRYTYAAVFNVAQRRLLRLADDDMRTVTYTDDSRWGIGRLDAPYRNEIAWGGSRADYYRIDLSSGERQLMVEGLRRTHGTSPDGRWFVYVQDSTLFAREIATGRTTDLSALAGVSFIDVDDDHPYELPSYGLAGWSRDGRHVLANHRFDVWLLPLDGAGQAVNLTRGIGDRDHIRFRVQRLDEEPTIDTSKPILLSAYGDRTKQSGYWRVRAGSAPEPVLYEDMAIGSLQKADSADRVLFTKQTFQVFPDYWVAGMNLREARQVTDANPHLAEFAWGRRILIDYTDARGNALQATLALPADYQPGRRYPMLVYFYEKMSQNHHVFSVPVYDDRPHMSAYASDGYLVLQPDIVYEIGRPGTSALDDVGSAVRKVIELGYADPDRIGLQGHSWGGYQSSFMVTQTDMFAAVVTGAPPTNLVSFYNELYKSTGTVQQGIMEIGQVRMGENATPWTAHELYESQSPVHQAENITTPFLILHGTEDGAVDWHQGLEFYNAARRLGKQVILLSYPGEGHHLGRKENQLDFQMRMKQYFDHYLKGRPAPKWLTDGVPHLQKETAGTRE